MAMGLGFLGRGKGWRAIYLGILHVVGAALGGAIIGALLGWFGSLLALSAWRSVAIAVTAIFALWQGVSHRPVRLGLHRQVPRKWANTMAAELCYFLWGMLLGSGVATVIPSSAFLVILVTQFSSGVVLGCISGLLFGGTRGVVALLPLLSKKGRLYPEKLPALLPTLRMKVYWFNILWIIGASVLLEITIWH
jgi:hypothetical protein